MARKEGAVDLELTTEQQRAVDGAADAPGRWTDPATGQVVVLLDAGDFDWIRDKLDDEPDAPRATHPNTGKRYALVPEGRYERYKAFFEEDPLTDAERMALLREAGKRAGWDDPIWDDFEGPVTPEAP
jgi:hypothetical protein